METCSRKLPKQIGYKGKMAADTVNCNVVWMILNRCGQDRWTRVSEKRRKCIVTFQRGLGAYSMMIYKTRPRHTNRTIEFEDISFVVVAFLLPAIYTYTVHVKHCVHTWCLQPLDNIGGFEINRTCQIGPTFKATRCSPFSPMTYAAAATRYKT